METAILFGVVTISALFISTWAHLAADNRGLAIAIKLAIGVVALLLALPGLVLLLAGPLSGSLDSRRVGTVLLTIGVLTGLPLVSPIRRLLARLMPFDPDSTPDTVGLCVLLGSVAFFATTSLLSQSDLEVTSVGTFELVSQALMFVLIAYFGVGLIVTRGFASANRRLGLGGLSAGDLLVALGLVVVAFVITGTAAWLTLHFQPELSEEIRQRTGALTENVSNFWGAMTLGISAGVGEEILFRGAIQPRFGIPFTAAIFALIHVQYGLSFDVLGVFLVAIVFGIERRRINTTAAVVTHIVYDVIAVLLSTLGP